MFSCSNFLEEINTKIHVISREYRAQSSDETGLCVDAEHTNALYAAALTRTFGLYAFLNTGVFKSEILRMALNRLDAPTLDNDEQPTSEPSKRETGTSATLESIFTELYRTLASCDGILPGHIRWVYLGIMRELCSIDEELPRCLRQGFRGDLSRYHLPTLPFLLPLVSEIQAVDFLLINSTNFLTWLGVESKKELVLKSSSMQQTDSFLSFMAKPTSATAPRSADWYRRLQRYSLARLQRAARDNLSSETTSLAAESEPTLTKCYPFFLMSPDLVQRQALGALSASIFFGSNALFATLMKQHRNALEHWMADVLLVTPDKTVYSVALQEKGSNVTSVFNRNKEAERRVLQETKKKKVWESLLWPMVVPSTNLGITSNRASADKHIKHGLACPEAALRLQYSIVEANGLNARDILTLLSFSLPLQATKTHGSKTDYSYKLFDKLNFRNHLFKTVPSSSATPKPKRWLCDRDATSFFNYHTPSHLLSAQVFSFLRYWFRSTFSWDSSTRANDSSACSRLPNGHPSPLLIASVVYGLRLLHQFVSHYCASDSAAPSRQHLLFAKLSSRTVNSLSSEQDPCASAYGMSNAYVIPCFTEQEPGATALRSETNEAVTAGLHYIGNRFSSTAVKKNTRCRCSISNDYRGGALAVLGFPASTTPDQKGWHVHDEAFVVTVTRNKKTAAHFIHVEDPSRVAVGSVASLTEFATDLEPSERSTEEVCCSITEHQWQRDMAIGAAMEAVDVLSDLLPKHHGLDAVSRHYGSEENAQNVLDHTLDILYAVLQRMTTGMEPHSVGVRLSIFECLWFYPKKFLPADLAHHLNCIIKSLYVVGPTQLGRLLADRLLRFIGTQIYRTPEFFHSALPGIAKLLVLYPRTLCAHITYLFCQYLTPNAESERIKPESLLGLLCILVELPVLVDIVAQFGSLLCGVYCTSSFNSTSKALVQASFKSDAEDSNISPENSDKWVISSCLALVCNSAEGKRCRCAGLRQLCKRFMDLQPIDLLKKLPDAQRTSSLFSCITTHAPLSNKASYVAHITTRWVGLIERYVAVTAQIDEAYLNCFLLPLLSLLPIVPGPLSYVLETQQKLMNIFLGVADVLPPKKRSLLVFSLPFSKAFPPCTMAITSDTRDIQRKKSAIATFLFTVITRIGSSLDNSFSEEACSNYDAASRLFAALNAWGCTTLHLSSLPTTTTSSPVLDQGACSVKVCPKSAKSGEWPTTTGYSETNQEKNFSFSPTEQRQHWSPSSTNFLTDKPATSLHGGIYAKIKRSPWKSFKTLKQRTVDNTLPSSSDAIEKEVALRLTSFFESEVLTLFCSSLTTIALPYPTLRVEAIQLLSKVLRKADQLCKLSVPDVDTNKFYERFQSIKQQLYTLATPEFRV